MAGRQLSVGRKVDVDNYRYAAERQVGCHPLPLSVQQRAQVQPAAAEPLILEYPVGVAFQPVPGSADLVDCLNARQLDGHLDRRKPRPADQQEPLVVHPDLLERPAGQFPPQHKSIERKQQQQWTAEPPAPGCKRRRQPQPEQGCGGSGKSRGIPADDQWLVGVHFPAREKWQNK